MSIKMLIDWSGRSREYINNLIHPLEWISAGVDGYRTYFIPDVADAIIARQLPREERDFYSLLHDANRNPYRDDLIGDCIRGTKVSMYSDTELRRDAVALADKIGMNNVSELLSVNKGTLSGWRYARTREEASGEPGIYAGIGSETSEELFARLAEKYGLDVEDIKARRKRYAERYWYLMR